MSHSMERVCIERLVLEPCPYQELQGAAFFFLGQNILWAERFRRLGESCFNSSYCLL